jgi:hypothetical protein
MLHAVSLLSLKVGSCPLSLENARAVYPVHEPVYFGWFNYKVFDVGFKLEWCKGGHLACMLLLIAENGFFLPCPPTCFDPI